MTSHGNKEYFFDVSLDLHCIASRDAKFVRLNPQWSKLLGFSEQELKAGTFLDLVHPDDIDETMAVMEQLNEGHSVVNFSNRYRTRDGGYLVLDWSSTLNAEDNLYYATARDVTQQRKAAERLQRTNQVLSAIHAAQKLYIAGGVNSQWWDQMLDALLKITESEYGFIGAVEDDAEGRHLRTFAITNIAWNEATRQFFESSVEEGLVFRNLGTLFGQVIVTEQDVIANEVANDPRAAGRPEGHPPLNRFLGLALHGSDGLVGMIGVANRQAAYTPELLETLTPVTNFLGALIESQKHKQRERDTDKRVRELQEMNTQILDSSTSFIFAMDLEGTCIRANRATRELLDVRDERHVRQLVSLQLLRQDRKWFDEQTRRVDSEGSVRVELELLSAANGVIACDFTLTGLNSSEGNLQGILFVGYELTIRKSLEASAIETAALLSRVEVLRKRQSEDELISSCVEYLLSCSSMEESHQIVYRHLRDLYPDAFVEVFAFESESDALERQWPQTDGPPPVFPSVDCWAMRSRRLHAWRADSTRMRCAHTLEQKAAMVACGPLRSYDSIFGMISIHFPAEPDLSREDEEALFETRYKRVGEISQRLSVALATVELKIRLERAALTDALTEVSNRRAFEQAVIRSIARFRRHKLQYAVVIVDVDHFKLVNDTHGHTTGDQVLKRIANVMRERIRTSDELGRIGGEEFCLLLEGTSEDEAVLKAERLRAAIEASELIPGRAITASFGVVHSGQLEGSTWKALYTAADRALYKAKQSGRNRVVLASD